MIIPDYREFKHSNELYHYGMPRRSGRYPWGSGENPYQGTKWSFNNVKINLKRTYDFLTGNYGTDKYVDIDGPYESLSDLKKKSGNPNENRYGHLNEIRSDCAFVNNFDDISQDGRNMNCVYCSVAMAMRQKGYRG